MIVLVNKNSNSGKGASKWEKVKKRLLEQGINFNDKYPKSEQECIDLMHEEIKKGEKIIIAAGGDGTANLVLNNLIDPKTDKTYKDITFGAIGLGSSNDFHKPFDEFQDIDGIPLRINSKDAKPIDVGKVKYTDTQGNIHTRYFILNASIGFVAEGNAYFNSGKKILNWINNRSNDLAILYVILVNLFTFKRFNTAIQLDDNESKNYIVSAMGIIKKVQFAGDMKYDTLVTEDDGMFDVNLWENMGRIKLLKTIAALFEGKFSNLPNTQTWRAKKIKITPARPIHLESDGEVVEITEAELTVLPKNIKVCR